MTTDASIPKITPRPTFSPLSRAVVFGVEVVELVLLTVTLKYVVGNDDGDDGVVVAEENKSHIPFDESSI